MSQQVRVRSRWWYLLPIFFNIIGGAIAYFILRDDDPKKAKNCLWLGIVLIAIKIGLFVIFLSICTSIGPCGEFHDELMSGMEGFMGQEDLMTQTQLMQQMMQDPEMMQAMMQNQQMMEGTMSSGMMMGSNPIEQHEKMLELMGVMMNNKDMMNHMFAHMIENEQIVHQMFTLMDMSPALKEHMAAHVSGDLSEYEHLDEMHDEEEHGHEDGHQ